MDDQDSEKKSEKIWVKYCEACVKSKIGSADRSHSEGCCTLNKEDTLNS